jgi:hypothetical protein
MPVPVTRTDTVTRDSTKLLVAAAERLNFSERELSESGGFTVTVTSPASAPRRTVNLNAMMAPLAAGPPSVTVTGPRAGQLQLEAVLIKA